MLLDTAENRDHLSGQKKIINCSWDRLFRCMRLPSTLGIMKKGGICSRGGVGGLVNKCKRLRSNKKSYPSKRKRRQNPWKKRCDTRHGYTRQSARRFQPSEGSGPRESEENSLSNPNPRRSRFRAKVAVLQAVILAQCWQEHCHPHHSFPGGVGRPHSSQSGAQSKEAWLDST